MEGFKLINNDVRFWMCCYGKFRNYSDGLYISNMVDILDLEEIFEKVK